MTGLFFLEKNKTNAGYVRIYPSLICAQLTKIPIFDTIYPHPN